MVESQKNETWLVETRGQREAGDVRSTRSVPCIGSAPNCAFGPPAKSRFLDPLTASAEREFRQASRWNIAISPGVKIARCTRPEGDCALHRHVARTRVGRPSTNLDRGAPDPWTRDQLTSRRGRNPAPRHPRQNPIGVNDAQVTPCKIRLNEHWRDIGLEASATLTRRGFAAEVMEARTARCRASSTGERLTRLPRPTVGRRTSVRAASSLTWSGGEVLDVPSRGRRRQRAPDCGPTCGGRRRPRGAGWCGMRIPTRGR